MKLTESQKKMLTEKLLKECWHELVRYKPGGIFRKCKKCGLGNDPENRTFLTWPDLGACKESLVREGLWKKFYWWAVGKSQEIKMLDSPDTAAWLFRPTVDGEPHFCRLVAEFMGVREDGDLHR